jgi:hypothetical protein
MLNRGQRLHPPKTKSYLIPPIMVHFKAYLFFFYTLTRTPSAGFCLNKDYIDLVLCTLDRRFVIHHLACTFVHLFFY